MTDLRKKWPTAQIAIREVGGKDIDALVELWQGQHDYHVTLDHDYYEPTGKENVQDARDYFKKAVEGNGPKILLAESCKRIVGFITLKKVSRNLGIARSGTRIKEY